MERGTRFNDEHGRPNTILGFCDKAKGDIMHEPGPHTKYVVCLEQFGDYRIWSARPAIVAGLIREGEAK